MTSGGLCQPHFSMTLNWAKCCQQDGSARGLWQLLQLPGHASHFTVRVQGYFMGGIKIPTSVTLGQQAGTERERAEGLTRTHSSSPTGSLQHLQDRRDSEVRMQKPLPLFSPRACPTPGPYTPGGGRRGVAPPLTHVTPRPRPRRARRGRGKTPCLPHVPQVRRWGRRREGSWASCWAAAPPCPCGSRQPLAASACLLPPRR